MSVIDVSEAKMYFVDERGKEIFLKDFSFKRHSTILEKIKWKIYLYRLKRNCRNKAMKLRIEGEFKFLN